MDINIEKEVEKLADDFGVDKKRSIGEVAKELKVETHVIRFWEENFPQIKPEIGRGGRRYYYNKQIKVLKRIKKFLHEDGYTIAGLQKMLKKRTSNQISNYKEEDLQIINSSGEKAVKSGRDISSSVISNLSAQNREEKAVAAENDTVFLENNAVEDSGEVSISDFINPGLDLSNDKGYNASYEGFSKKKPKDEIFSLMRNISKNLGELKFLLRS